MSDAPDPTEHAGPIRLDDRQGRDARSFALAPGAAARAALAEALGLDGLRKLRFEGRLVPVGRRDWDLEASLGATVVQACGVTLAPVVTRIDEAVVRRYREDHVEPETTGDVEMPEDDTTEPLPATVDPAQVMAEALALAAPDFPRAPDAEPVALTVTEPGAEPMSDEAARPFAGLKDALKGEG